MKKLLLLFFLYNVASAQQKPDLSLLALKAPETFRAVFTTTKGEVVIEAYRRWSPLGVDRLYQLIVSGYYNNALLFRVEPDFVTQFGIAADAERNRFWDPKKIKDEPRTQKNEKGTISFARDGRNDRCAQLFINNTDNPKLDTTVRNGVAGYTPIARIVKGMDIAARFHAQYRKQPALIQDSLYKYGNTYFEKKFPGLDRIISTAIVK